MTDVNLIAKRDNHVENGRSVTSLEFLLPIQPIILAINSDSKSQMPPFVMVCGQLVMIDAITPEQDGRILDGRPKLQSGDYCHGEHVYEGKRGGRDYRLAFAPITSTRIETIEGVDHQAVIDDMITVMKEVYKLN